MVRKLAIAKKVKQSMSSKCMDCHALLAVTGSDSGSAF